MKLRYPGLLVALLGTSAAGCNSTPQGGGCGADSECTATQACLARVCVAREPGPRALHISVVPAAGLVAAPTEFSDALFGGPVATTLQLQRVVPVAGKAKSPATALFALLVQGELSINAQLPSRIPGAAAVEMNAVASIKSVAGVAEAEFVLPVPESRLGELAAFRLVPRAPVDAVTPPVEAQLNLLNNLIVPLPGATDLRFVEGSVRTEFDKPALGYAVQVLRLGQTVSNKATVGVDGRFRVGFSIAADPLNDAASLLVSLPSLTTLPRLRVNIPSAASDMGAIRLPAHPTPQLFRVPVVSLGTTGTFFPVVGALVRFETVLPSTGPGVVSRYLQEIQSGKDGTVDLPLIGGVPESTRSYSVEVTSPSFSEAGSVCIANFAIGAASSDTKKVPTAAVIELPRRPALAGVVRRPDLSPVRGAVVTAVRLGPLPGAVDCAVPNRLGDPNTITNVDGIFRLRVDSGVFRIEVRPPTGEAIPFTTWDAVITNVGLQMDLPLPAGRVADGKLLTLEGTPCAACRVLVYEGTAQALTLRAETVSGPFGLFRVILPAL